MRKRYVAGCMSCTMNHVKTNLIQSLFITTGFILLPNLSAAAQSKSSGGNEFNAPFLWAPINLEGARDLGHVPVEIPLQDQAPAGAIAFTDATVAAGLGGVVGGGNAHGVALGFFDIDKDGWDDLFVINGQSYASKLFKNDGDGTFTDISVASGFAAIMAGKDGYSIAGGDMDADGDVDVYIGTYPTDMLLINQGNGTFIDGSVAAAVGGPAVTRDGENNKIVSVGDYNNDGWLDLLSAASTMAAPGAYLLENNGDGTFTDVTTASNISINGTGNPCAIMWSDYDNDGDTDLWIWNDRGGHIHLRNDNGSLVDVTTTSSTVNISHPMGIDGADIDRDGDLDYYVSNFGDHPLLLNNDNGTFSNGTVAAGTAGDFGWGLAFEDFNHDGWSDIFITQEDNRPYFAYTNLKTNPPQFSRADVAHITVGNAHNVAAAFADYDGDGRVDGVTATTDGSRIMLYRNVTDPGSHRWLEVVVPRTPGTNERGGISARVVVKTGDELQFRDITGGSSRASQNAISVRFGLGNWTGADMVAALWPDGRQLVVTGVAGNQKLELLLPDAIFANDFESVP